VILGAQWNKESENTKARFVNMAKQLKARHQLEHPDYQYQPRKPSEKKRRMTQRKKAALAEASHSKPDPNLESATEAYGNAFVADEFAIPVPKLPQTLGGNAMLELGDQDLDDQTLSAMLEEYNSGRPTIQNQAANIITHCSPPVIYGEPSEEAQEQKSFYSNFHPYSSNKSLSAEMEAVMAYKQDCPAGLGPSTFQANFDEQQEYLFNAELNRMCHWNDQPAVFQP